MSALLSAILLMALFFQHWPSLLCSAIGLGAVITLRTKRTLRRIATGLAATSLLILLLSTILLSAEVSYGFPEEDVTAVYGIVSQDSVVGKWDRRRISLSLKECFIQGGESASARGLVNVTYPDGVRLYSGDAVLFIGKVDDYGFSARWYRLIGQGGGIRSRKRITALMEERLSAVGVDEANLAIMLTLGYSAQEDFLLTELARDSGTSYVLALSGMHLSLLAMLLRFTLKPLVGERRARLLALLVVSLYVFLIGPRPSIIRAWLLSAVFLLFRGIRGHDALMATFVLQGLLFPEGLTTLASTYSYLSLVGIMSLSGFLKESLDNLVLLPSFIATNMTASLAALLFTCPLSYLVFGEYQLSVILTGGLASVLVYIYMVLSLASLAVPLPSLLSLVYKACGAVMDFGASFPMCTSPWGYIVLLLISLSGIMLSAILNAKRRTPCGLSTTQASRRSLRSLASRLLR